MEFKNCSSCGKLFKNVSMNVCSSCLRKDEEQFQIVKKYLAKEPGAGIQEVVDETGVSYDDIVRYLKEERLELKGEEVVITCESCGVPITTGRFCTKCVNNLKTELSSVTERNDEKQDSNGKRKDVRFRIVDRYSKDKFKKDKK